LAGPSYKRKKPTASFEGIHGKAFIASLVSDFSMPVNGDAARAIEHINAQNSS